MTVRLSQSSIPGARASGQDHLDTPRLSRRFCLLILITVSALGYGLTYQAASLIWQALAGG